MDSNFFHEVIGFEILGGFDNEAEKEDLIDRAEELGLDPEDYDTIEELIEAIEDEEDEETEADEDDGNDEENAEDD